MYTTQKSIFLYCQYIIQWYSKNNRFISTLAYFIFYCMKNENPIAYFVFCIYIFKRNVVFSFKLVVDLEISYEIKYLL